MKSKPTTDSSSEILADGISTHPSAREIERRAMAADRPDAKDMPSVHAEHYRRLGLYFNTAGVELVMHETPTIEYGEAVDVVATVMENIEVFGGRRMTQKSGEPPQSAVHSNMASLKEDFQVLRDQIEISVANRDRYVKKHGDPVMAEKCMWLHLGFPMLAGAANLAQLIKLLKQDKATVGKCMAYFQDQTPKLPLLEGQRDKAARKNMTIAREKQLPPVEETTNAG